MEAAYNRLQNGTLNFKVTSIFLACLSPAPIKRAKIASHLKIENSGAGDSGEKGRCGRREREIKRRRRRGGQEKEEKRRRDSVCVCVLKLARRERGS